MVTATETATHQRGHPAKPRNAIRAGTRLNEKDINDFLLRRKKVRARSAANARHPVFETRNAPATDRTE